MNDWVRIVGNLRRLLSELPSSPTDDPDIGRFEALEREISAAVEELYIERIEKTVRSLAGRARTKESLEKTAGEVQEIFREIIKKKLAEDRLEHRCELFGWLLDSSADGILAFDLQCIVTFCNPTLERFLGVDKQEIIGKNLLKELPCSKELGEDRFVLEALAGKTITSRNRSHTIPGTNRDVFFDAHYSPLSGESEKVLGGVVVIRDVTDQRETERGLEQAREELETRMQEHTAARDQIEQKLAQEMADLRGAKIRRAQETESSAMLVGHVARDYDELFTDVLGHAGSVLEEIPPDSPARHSVEQIEAAALRASELTHQLLAYSGKITLDQQPLLLGRLVDEMKHSLETLISPKASLELRILAHTPPIKSDASQIRQLILNLVKNASEGLREQEGVITIGTGTMEADRVYLSESLLGEKLPEGFYVYIEVMDTGEGMDEETLSKSCVPFFTTKPGNSGLGLATVVGTVQSHRGAINVTSVPGEGTTFRVLFPQYETPGETRVDD